MSRAIAIPLILGAGFLIAMTATSQAIPKDLIPTGDILITDNDTVWDYKRENGIWWTKRKGNSTWLNMRQNLSDEMYNEAMQVLEFYLMKKYRNIQFTKQ